MPDAAEREKPRLFIGSSAEALDTVVPDLVAELKKARLRIDINVWNEGPWKNFRGTLENLMAFASTYSFAVLVGTPDDFTNKRHHVARAVRDNVLFELGLFLNALGPDRTFLLVPEDVRKGDLPSDLDGAFLLRCFRLTSHSPPRLASFKGNALVELIRTELKGDTGARPGATDELRRTLQGITSALGGGGNGRSAVTLLKERLEKVVALKAKASDQTTSEAVNDIVNFLWSIPDVLDVDELARRQSHDSGVSKVWVFSDRPLEFEDGTPAFRRLRQTIVDNLANNVAYTYFVSPGSAVETLKSFANGLHFPLDELRRLLNVVVVEDGFFKTYFTLHFKATQTNPTAVYMSSLLPERKDLLIQVQGDHAQRIYRRLQWLSGKEDLPNARFVDFTIR